MNKDLLRQFLETPIDSHYIPENIEEFKKPIIIERKLPQNNQILQLENEWNKRLTKLIDKKYKSKQIIPIIPHLLQKEIIPPKDPHNRLNIETVSKIRSLNQSNSIIKPKKLPELRYFSNHLIKRPLNHTIKLY